MSVTRKAAPRRKKLHGSTCTAILGTLLVLAVGACGRGPAGTDRAAPAAGVADARTAPVVAPVVASDTTLAQPGIQPERGAMDAKAFAGPFEGTLPCADCPGIDERLVLSPDGSFILTDVYRERPGGGQTLRGNWSIEPDGASLRLDPGSKDAQDRLFGIEDNDTLVPLGADGNPTGAPGEPRLRRSR